MKTNILLDHIQPSFSQNQNCFRKSCRENQNSHFMFKNFFFSENRSVYEIMWKNIVERGGPQMTIWRMGIAYWIPKATNTPSEYVIISLSHCNNGYADASECTLPVLCCLCLMVYRMQLISKEGRNRSTHTKQTNSNEERIIVSIKCKQHVVLLITNVMEHANKLKKTVSAPQAVQCRIVLSLLSIYGKVLGRDRSQPYLEYYPVFG